MTVLPWGVSAEVRGRAFERAQEEKRAARVARAQVRALRRQRRRDMRLRVFGWCRRNKMAVYPVGAVASFATGLFTVGVLWGFLALALGLVVLEWRFSK